MTPDRASTDAVHRDERLPADFWRLWTGGSVSAFGTYVTLLALQVLVLVTLHGDAQDVGWLNACRWLPYLLFGLLAGAWVERRRRRPVMVVADVACGALLAVIPLAWALDRLSVSVLLIIVLLYGAAALFGDAASMAMLPRVVPRAQLQRAHARSDGSAAVAQTAGPAIAGVLIRLLGAPAAVLVDAASYVFSAVVTSTLRVNETPSAARISSVRRDIGDGVRWIYGGTTLRALAIGTHVWFAANATLGVVVPTFALQTLHLSVLQLGITSAVAGIGAIVGAAVTTAIGRRLRTGRTVITTHLLSIVGVVVMALAGSGDAGWTTTLTLAAGQALHGIAMGMSNSHETGYRQAVTPDHLQARTNITMRAFNRAVIVVFAPRCRAFRDTHRHAAVPARRRCDLRHRRVGPRSVVVPERRHHRACLSSAADLRRTDPCPGETLVRVAGVDGADPSPGETLVRVAGVDGADPSPGETLVHGPGLRRAEPSPGETLVRGPGLGRTEPSPGETLVRAAGVEGADPSPGETLVRGPGLGRTEPSPGETLVRVTCRRSSACYSTSENTKP